jgi:ATP-binding cassette subfamily B protein
VAVVCSIVFIGSVNLTMAGALVAASVALGALIFYLARRGTPLHRSFATKAAAVDGELVDVIGNMGVVRAFGAMFREQSRIASTIGIEMGARRASLIYLERLRLIHAVITTLLIAGVVAWGITLWQGGAATVGDLVLITSLSFGILHCTRDLAVALVDLTQHVARLEEAIGSLLIPHELPDRPGARPLLQGVGDVTFDAVSFAYPGRAPVLREFDLTIQPGQRVGLVGYSGAGKSTVLGLLQRFYDVGGGRILIDGQDIRDVTQESLRASMAIVPQDISLFHRTVLENIRYANPDAHEREVMAAAEMANCREFIEALPDGFDTMVGDRGVKLSGGQRQRLAIARALVLRPSVYLFDDSFSALDYATDARLRAALADETGNATVVIVAQRVSTIRGADRIVVLDEGRVVGSGTHGELMDGNRTYREIVLSQLTEQEAA